MLKEKNHSRLPLLRRREPQSGEPGVAKLTGRNDDDHILLLFHQGELFRMSASDKCKYERKFEAEGEGGV